MAINGQTNKGGLNTSAFISYSHEDRQYGAQAKEVLAQIGIGAFLAHDDLHVSDEWRARIIEELKRCGLFVPLFSANFLTSKWAPQEVGFVISRPEVVIAPISLDGTTPFGFISHIQSRLVTKDGITRELLVEPLARRMPRTILPGLIQIAAKAATFRSAEALMAPLVPHFPIFTPDEAQALAAAAVENGQIWLAAVCKSDYLPGLIKHQGKNIDPKTLRALTYQIEKDEWYRGD